MSRQGRPTPRSGGSRGLPSGATRATSRRPKIFQTPDGFAAVEQDPDEGSEADFDEWARGSGCRATASVGRSRRCPCQRPGRSATGGGRRALDLVRRRLPDVALDRFRDVDGGRPRCTQAASDRRTSTGRSWTGVRSPSARPPSSLGRERATRSLRAPGIPIRPGEALSSARTGARLQPVAGRRSRGLPLPGGGASVLTRSGRAGSFRVELDGSHRDRDRRRSGRRRRQDRRDPFGVPAATLAADLNHGGIGYPGDGAVITDGAPACRAPGALEFLTTAEGRFVAMTGDNLGDVAGPGTCGLRRTGSTGSPSARRASQRKGSTS